MNGAIAWLNKVLDRIGVMFLEYNGNYEVDTFDIPSGEFTRGWVEAF